MTTPTRSDCDHRPNLGDGPTVILPGGRSDRPVPPAPMYGPGAGYVQMPPHQAAPQMPPFAPQWGPPDPTRPWAPYNGAPMPPRRTGFTKFALVAAVAAVVAAGSVIALNTGSDDSVQATKGSTVKLTPTLPSTTTEAPTTTATPPLAPVPTDLMTLLLTSDQIGSITRAPMQANGEKHSLLDDSPEIDPASCASAWNPIQVTSYRGSGYRDVAAQAVTDGDTKQHVVLQGVVSFTSPTAAQAYLDTAAASWNACANRPLTYTDSDGVAGLWQLGAVEDVVGGAFKVISQTPEGGRGWQCERALGASGSVVIDTMACGGPDSAGQAAAVAGMIARNVGA
jgi:hypothetical protein